MLGGLISGTHIARFLRPYAGGADGIRDEWLQTFQRGWVMQQVNKEAEDALFLLVRHGQTLLNKKDKFRGWSEDESAALDKKGIKEAKIAGRFLSKLPIKIGIIISSDLDRALHTAAIIATILGINDIHHDARLRPINVGSYTGEDKADTDIDHYLENPEVSFPGGESIDDFRNRQKEFSTDLYDWMKEHPNEKAIVIAHLSTVIYWEDMAKAMHGYLKNYATDKEDLIHPGGVAAIMPDNKVIALLGENKKATLSDKGEE